MSRLKCYDPQAGQMYQLICRYNTREWEHCDYAETRTEKDYLLTEYRLAYQGTGMEVSYIVLPQKYWDKEKERADRQARRARIKEKQLSKLIVNQSGELSHENN